MKKIFFLLIIVLSTNIIISNTSFAAEVCTINSAEFNPSGEQTEFWFKEKQTSVNINVSTTNCVGKSISLTLSEEDTLVGNWRDDDLTDSKLEDRSIPVPSDDFKIILRAGEEECGANYLSFDCDIYFVLKAEGGNYGSHDKPKGFLYYECDGACNENWELISPLEDTTNKNSAVVVEPEQLKKEFSNEYKLLAPIGNLESIGGDSDNKIGDYLNIILMIAIGLCGALAVIMIVVRGVQYMGDESVFGKTEAKHHIMQAVLGLLLALGAYAILNTINPKLVGGSLTFNSVNIELDGSPMTSNDAVPPPGTKVARCPEGIVTIETSGGKLPVCKSFSTNLKSLIDTAWAEGYKIYGYGFRTSASQINLRKRHCGGDSYYNIYLKPSGKCIPPTATPGNSMHESGLAFDFTCEGASITSRSNKCFIWLQKNASKYGLKNLSSEPWHWSTNGN
jgi:hypothetical protein